MINDQATMLRNELKTARFVTVASGKGGVGKSLVTMNVAVSLSKMNKKVLVIDMDVGFANLEVLGGLHLKHTLKDFFSGVDLGEIIEKTKYGFWLLSSGNDVNDIYAFQMGERERLFSEFQKLGSEMDYILIDMGAGYSELMDNIYTITDDFILVITPEPTSIMDGYTFLKILSIKELKSRMLLVVNMVNDLSEGRILIKKFGEVITKFTSLQFEKSYSILNDPRVRRSVRDQKPFVISHEKIQPTFGIIGISSAIAGRDYKNNAPKKMSFANKIKRFFRLER